MFILSPAITFPVLSETVTINVLPLSRYGRKHDVAHIHNLIRLQQPLASPQKFLVPDVGTSTVPKITFPNGTAVSFDVIDAGAVEKIKAEITRQMQEFLATPEAKELVQLNDMMQTMLGLTMSTTEQEIPAGTSIISFSYSKEIPVENNVATLETMVPLASFTAQNGSRLQCTIALPFDPPIKNPQGVWKRPDGNNVNMPITTLQGNRFALSAFWQNDPVLKVTYSY